MECKICKRYYEQGCRDYKNNCLGFVEHPKGECVEQEFTFQLEFKARGYIPKLNEWCNYFEFDGFSLELKVVKYLSIEWKDNLSISVTAKCQVWHSKEYKNHLLAKKERKKFVIIKNN